MLMHNNSTSNDHFALKVRFYDKIIWDKNFMSIESSRLLLIMHVEWN